MTNSFSVGTSPVLILPQVDLGSTPAINGRFRLLIQNTGATTCYVAMSQSNLVAPNGFLLIPGAMWSETSVEGHNGIWRVIPGGPIYAITASSTTTVVVISW